MDEGKVKDCKDATVSDDSGTKFGKESFRMYYALGPEVEQGHSIDYDAGISEDFKHRKYKYFTSDFEEDSDENVTNQSNKEIQTAASNLHDVIDIKDEELSDDSGTVDDHEWKGCSIPPDVVASANRFKVIREEPRKNISIIDGDIRKSEELFSPPCDQDITDFRRHQVEAYTNLEDLLDEPWEESDFEPPSKVVHSDSSRDIKRKTVLQKVGVIPSNHCGPLCSSCSIM